VPRSELAKHFEWADVFLLPSICEGSATVTYEALAHGLPVVCTANTGSVVRDEVDGFIVPARDPAAVTARLCRLLEDPELLDRLSSNAATRAKQFTVVKYGDRLTSVLRITHFH
jgi:glycosyltransferase involved in cell wall biosynthesis